ncbi:glycosyltransferase family 2 protein [Bartonella tamiae]|uniref:glycosyltransferase family 2 protein n=1 Tax=Bartonella tamiae TaxID=373638 RepID=UPI00026E888A|nr:glycosyltransferase family 2 protein [Bartonella tamiae]EJF94715.1 hypothetical protein MEG_00296 [Bartonella tamiae Th307]
MNKISFIVICYNQVDDIDNVFESIFNQNVDQDYEVIVSDDGSTDGTIEKIQKWKEKYHDKLKLFIQPRDKNIAINVMTRIANSFKCAMKNMTGQYFCLFDGDDYCVNNNFAKNAIEIMDKDSSIGSVVFDFEYRFLDKREKAYYHVSDEGIVDKYAFFANNYAHSGTFVFRNNLNNSRIDELTNSPFVIDNTIIPFMLQFGNLYYKPELSYSYRVFGGTWDKRIDEEKFVFTVLISAILSKISSRFQAAFDKRIFQSFKYIYDNKQNLRPNMDKDTFDQYVKIAKDYKSYFIYDCLFWNEINFLKRIRLFFCYKLLKSKLGL